MKLVATISVFAVFSARSLDDDLDYFKGVYPFLKSNCISWHNKTTTKADLNMETPELIIKGDENVQTGSLR